MARRYCVAAARTSFTPVKGDRRAARHRGDMGADAQVLGRLIVPETVRELVRDALQVAVDERHIEQLLAVHRMSVLVTHLADDLVSLMSMMSPEEANAYFPSRPKVIQKVPAVESIVSISRG